MQNQKIFFLFPNQSKYCGYSNETVLLSSQNKCEKIFGKKNIHNFRLKDFAYCDLSIIHISVFTADEIPVPLWGIHHQKLWQQVLCQESEYDHSIETCL